MGTFIHLVFKNKNVERIKCILKQGKIRHKQAYPFTDIGKTLFFKFLCLAYILLGHFDRFVSYNSYESGLPKIDFVIAIYSIKVAMSQWIGKQIESSTATLCNL